MSDIIVFAISSATDALPRDWNAFSGQQILISFLAILALVILNGFFVASEFAIVKVRGSQLDALAAQGRRGILYSRRITSNLEAYLSATQLGITIASLGLGWLGEPFIARFLSPVFYAIYPDAPSSYDATIHVVALVIAFSIIIFLHVVLGELIPKALAIRLSLGTTLTVSRPLHWFYLVFKPAIWVLNGTANYLLRLVFRLSPEQEQEFSHTSDELRLIVEDTKQSAEVTETERAIVINALELSEIAVRDIMTPRSEVVCLDPDNHTFEENLKIAIESKHTRFPLIRGHLDNTIGLVHIKDIITLIGTNQPDLLQIKKAIPPVPEMMAIDKLLKFFLARNTHLTIVVDEYGGTVGIVALEDVLEEVVGEIRDEFDEEDRDFVRINSDEFRVHGGFALYELEDHSDLSLETPDVSTVGGYVTQQFGRLPKEDETIVIEDYLVRVEKTDGRRVLQLYFKRQKPSGDRALNALEPQEHTSRG